MVGLIIIKRALLKPFVRNELEKFRENVFTKVVFLLLVNDYCVFNLV